MIIDGSRLVVTDNSGAKEVECIKTRGRYASIGDIITCSVKKAIKGKVSQVHRPALGARPLLLATSLRAFGSEPAPACLRCPIKSLCRRCTGQTHHTTAACRRLRGQAGPLLTPPATLCCCFLLQGQVVKAVVVETKKEVQRKDGRCVGCRRRRWR